MKSASATGAKTLLATDTAAKLRMAATTQMAVRTTRSGEEAGGMDSPRNTRTRSPARPAGHVRGITRYGCKARSRSWEPAGGACPAIRCSVPGVGCFALLAGHVVLQR